MRSNDFITQDYVDGYKDARDGKPARAETIVGGKIQSTMYSRGYLKAMLNDPLVSGETES